MGRIRLIYLGAAGRWIFSSRRSDSRYELKVSGGPDKVTVTFSRAERRWCLGSSIWTPWPTGRSGEHEVPAGSENISRCCGRLH